MLPKCQNKFDHELVGLESFVMRVCQIFSCHKTVNVNILLQFHRNTNTTLYSVITNCSTPCSQICPATYATHLSYSFLRLAPFDLQKMFNPIRGVISDLISVTGQTLICQYYTKYCFLNNCIDYKFYDTLYGNAA